MINISYKVGQSVSWQITSLVAHYYRRDLQLVEAPRKTSRVRGFGKGVPAPTKRRGGLFKPRYPLVQPKESYWAEEGDESYDGQYIVGRAARGARREAIDPSYAPLAAHPRRLNYTPSLLLGERR